MKMEVSDETENFTLTDDVRRGFLLRIAESALGSRVYVRLE